MGGGRRGDARVNEELHRIRDEAAGNREALRDLAEENAELRGAAAGAHGNANGGDAEPPPPEEPLAGGFARGTGFEYKSGSFFDQTPLFVVWTGLIMVMFYGYLYAHLLGLGIYADRLFDLLGRFHPDLGRAPHYSMDSISAWFARSGNFRLVCERCRGGGRLRGCMSVGAILSGVDDDVRPESLRVQEAKYRASYVRVRFFEYSLGIGGFLAAVCPRIPFWYSERMGHVCVELLTHLTTAANIDFHSDPVVVCERLKQSARSFNVVNLDKKTVLFGAAVVQDTWLVAYHYYLQIREERSKELGFLPRLPQIG